MYITKYKHEFFMPGDRARDDACALNLLAWATTNQEDKQQVLRFAQHLSACDPEYAERCVRSMTRRKRGSRLLDGCDGRVTVEHRASTNDCEHGAAYVLPGHYRPDCGCEKKIRRWNIACSSSCRAVPNHWSFVGSICLEFDHARRLLALVMSMGTPQFEYYTVCRLYADGSVRHIRTRVFDGIRLGSTVHERHYLRTAFPQARFLDFVAHNAPISDYNELDRMASYSDVALVNAVWLWRKMRKIAPLLVAKRAHALRSDLLLVVIVLVLMYVNLL